MNILQKSKLFLKLSKYMFKYANKNFDIDATLNTDSSIDTTTIDEDAKSFVSDLESLGSTYIKLGQLLSTRRELLPPEFILALKKLQSNVEPVAYPDIANVVQDELKAPINKLFSFFDDKPLATASLGQVHRATLMDGTEVVVKVQKPNIVATIKDDLASMRKLVNFLNEKSESFRKYHFQSVLNEFEDNIINELDYDTEFHNLNVISDNLEEFTLLHFPKAYKSYSTHRVLTMDFIVGDKLDEISEFYKTEVNGKVIAKQVFEAYLKQIFVDGFFHSDPHLGNMILIDNDNLGIIDLGMVTKLGPDLRKDLLTLLVAISSGKGAEAAEIAYKLSSNIPGVNQDIVIFKQMISNLIKEEYDRSVKQIKAGSILMSVSKIASNSGLYFPQELSSIARTLMYLDDLARILDPEFNPHEAVRDNATKLFKANYTENLSLSDVFLGAQDLKNFISEFPSKANRLLDDINNQKFSLKIDAIDEVLLLKGIQKIANRITSGLILAAMIIAAAMMMKVDNGFVILGYPGLAFILFMFATLGGVLLLFNMLLKDK